MATIAWRVLARSAIVGCLVCLATSGCRSMGYQGPVSQSVVMGRQLTQQGVNAMERGDWYRAESLLERAVDTSKEDPYARRSYAEALWHRGAQPLAIEQLEEARKLAGADPTLAVRTGELYLAMGETATASALVEEALALDPKLASAWALRGRVAAVSGRMREALADYHRSLGYVPGNYDVTILVAETHRQLNEPDRALVALQSLGERFAPGDEPQQVLQLQGLALVALGRYDEAVDRLSTAAERQRPTADLLCQLAEAELMSGQTARARHVLDQALAMNPAHPAGRALAARLAAAPGPIVR